MTAPLVLLASILVWMGLTVLLVHAVHTVAPALGAVGIIVLFLALATVVMSSGVAHTADRLVSYPSGLFRALGLKRTPVLSLVLVWIVAAGLLVKGDDRLYVTLAADPRPGCPPGWRQPRRRRRPSRRRSKSGWGTTASPTSRPPARRPGARPAVPLVIVASSGGGARAGAWTALVMDAAFGYAGDGQPCLEPEGVWAAACPREATGCSRPAVSPGAVWGSPSTWPR